MINPKKMSQMMKQAQQMQKKMSAVQETLEDLIVEGIAADGMIKVKMDGNQKLLDINIDPAAQNEKLDVLEDLILIAVNQAVIKSQNKAQKRMNAVTGNILGNIKLPGM
jgi:DNA-binding YbaB/EbfC family protein